MKLFLVFVLSLVLVRSKLLLPISDIGTPFVFKRPIIANQICKGSFKLSTPTEGSLDVTIFSEEGKRVFYKRGLKSQETVDFSFNTTEPQTFQVQIEQGDPVPEKTVLVEYEITSQFNTFNKAVAKSEVLEPALLEISRIEKLLYELSLQTSFRQKEIAAFSNSINDIVISIPCINFIMFIAFAGILGYQMISFKDFLKKKKLI
ncbi:p24 family protein delta-1 [Nematocida homosporus]|uniref:p24 family protein delta-1 n=1 Tax=Nematocida homosporus TaxID=1912981 RepID=UPI002220BC15|nr:p24 family protein delta-1 [Nematocida homosporus]KAI5185516.1 p24 family protein delta-1 [Nematocida homosporus]